jgi:hypothetical protein
LRRSGGILEGFSGISVFEVAEEIHRFLWGRVRRLIMARYGAKRGAGGGSGRSGGSRRNAIPVVVGKTVPVMAVGAAEEKGQAGRDEMVIGVG